MTEFSKINDSILESTLTKWQEQASELGDIGTLLLSDIRKKLEWAKNHEKNTPDAHTYCLLDESDTYARSIVEVTHVLPNSDEHSRLKLLDITLEPNLNFEANESPSEEMVKSSFEVISLSIIESLLLTYEELPSKGLKLYGRTNRMVGMFDRIVSSGKMDAVLERCGLNIKQENKWLVIYKK